MKDPLYRFAGPVVPPRVRKLILWSALVSIVAYETAIFWDALT